MRWGSAVLGVLLIGVAVVLFTGWAPWAWASHEQRGQVDAHVVRLDTSSGGVAVRRGDVDRIQLVARTLSWWNPEPSWRQHGDVLELADCGWGCSVSYDLVVPAGVRVEGSAGSGSVRVSGADAVDVEVGSGSIEARDVAGAVRASTNSGSVRLERVGGAVTALSSSGTVSGRDLAGPVDASSSSGDVDLTLTRPQNVHAVASSGDVDVTVPPGRYRIATEGTGDHEYPAAVVNDPAAPYRLELRSSSGDAVVHAD